MISVFEIIFHQTHFCLTKGGHGQFGQSHCFLQAPHHGGEVGPTQLFEPQLWSLLDVLREISWGCGGSRSLLREQGLSLQASGLTISTAGSGLLNLTGFKISRLPLPWGSQVLCRSLISSFHRAWPKFCAWKYPHLPQLKGLMWEFLYCPN